MPLHNLLARLGCRFCPLALLALYLIAPAGSAEPPVGLEIFPSTITIQAGAEAQFAALAHSSQGTAYTPQNLIWQATGGKINQTGAYRAGNLPGEFSVTVAHGAYRSTAHVFVTPSQSPLARIQVEPPSAALSVGQRLQFHAKGFAADGQMQAFVPTWRTGAGARITADGHFTASAPGRYTVTASNVDSSAFGVATVIVRGTPPQVARLEIKPASARVLVNQLTRFTVTAYDRAGGPLPVTPLWSASGGRIDRTGLYRAGTNPGYFRVRVTDRRTNLSATAIVQVLSDAGR
jgi:hypothetical protein